MITQSEFWNLEGKRIKTGRGEYVVLSAKFGRKWYTVQMTTDDGKIYTLRTQNLGMISIVDNKKSDKKVQTASSEKVSEWNSKKYEKQSSWMDKVYSEGIKPGDTAMVRVQGRSCPQPFVIDKITNNGIVSHYPNGRAAIIKCHQIAELKKEEVKQQVVRRARRRRRGPLTLADIMRGM